MPSRTLLSPSAVPVPRTADLLVKSFDRRRRRFRKAWRKARHRWTESSAHDLRVAARRMSALLDVLVHVLPQSELEKGRAGLKRLLSRLSPVRDGEIVSDYVQKSLVQFPQLSDFHRSLEKKGTRSLEKFSQFIGRQSNRELDEELGRVRDLLRTELVRTDNPDGIRRTVISAVDSEFENLMQLKERCDGISLTRMHRLRVSFKKFRYAMEALRPLFNDVNKEELAGLQNLQSALGDIQDLEVIEAHLKSWATKQKRKVRKSLGSVYTEISSTRQMRIQAAFQSCDEVYSLWKAIQERNVQFIAIPGGQS